MSKKLKIFITFIIVIIIICIIGLGVTGNYLYNLALNPDTDKSMIFNNDKTQNKEEFNAVNQLNIKQTQDVYINSVDDLKLHGYEINNQSNTWVIAVHGYTSEASKLSDVAYEFNQRGYSILLPDLRGHGESEGNYIAMGWDDRLDIISWIDYINENYNPENIILYGVSMGAATVMNVSGETLPENVRLVIEDCGYTSTWDIFSYQLDSLFNLPAHPFLDAANVITWFKAGYTLKQGPIDQVSKTNLPILFIHGDSDAFVPSYMIDLLYEKASGPKEKLIIPNAGHAQANEVDPTTYWNAIDQFINQYI